MDTPYKRLEQWREFKRDKARLTDFAESVDIPYTTLKSAEKKGSLSPDIISKLRNFYPDLNIEWLMFGDGEMLRGGRVLSPASAAAAVAPVAVSTSRPAPVETDPAVIDFRDKYIERLESALEAERERVNQLLLMLGKPSGNLSYAAEPMAAYYTPTSAAPIGPRFDDCLVVPMWPAAGSAEVTPLRQAN